MKNQRQCVVLSICSLVIGNTWNEGRTMGQLETSDLENGKLVGLPVASEEKGAETVEAGETSGQAELPAIQPAKQQIACHLSRVIARVVGTMLVAFVIWKLFDRKRKAE